MPFLWVLSMLSHTYLPPVITSRPIEATSLELLYFTAPWCVPCKTFKPIMLSVTRVPVRTIDVDTEPSEATKYNVYSVPTVIALRGTDEAGRFSGARSREFVDNFIASHLG